ncbi:MAG: HIT domain-containing protein [Chromatiales bacterium]|nr:HIT domain-containing protein [Chromatiales bacterium]
MAYDDSNIFARILRGEAPAHVVHEDALTIAILDVMPQAEGHTLILPRVPAENLFDLPEAHAAAVMASARRVGLALQEALACDGITVMQFNGAAAGQTVFHYHLHLVPRWSGKPLMAHAREPVADELLVPLARKIRSALPGGP